MAAISGAEVTKTDRNDANEASDASKPDTIIKSLSLEPHPEGGHFKEVFRDTAVDSTGRSRSTAIYYLLKSGQHSQLHRLDASEGWHHYLGGCLEIVEISDTGPKVTKLGKSLADGERPSYTVPPGTWFGARPAVGTDFVLAGCTVAPAFDFEKFEMGDRELLLKNFGDNEQSKQWINTLMPKS